MQYQAMIDDFGVVRDLLALSSDGVYRRLDKTWIPLDPDDDEFDVSEWPVEECSDDFIDRFDHAQRFEVSLDVHDIV